MAASLELYAAASAGQPKVVRALLASGTVSTEHCTGALFNATKNWRTGVLVALLNDGRADPTACISYPLRFAAANGWPGAVEALLTDGRADLSAVRFQGCHPRVQRMIARAVRWRRRRPWLRAAW
jgi:hypothetical protein